MQIKKLLQPKKILTAYILINLVVGIFLVKDYGRSTDEEHESNTATVALSMYTLGYDGSPIDAYDARGLDQYYGTASTTLVRFVEQILFPNANHLPKVVAHYCYFLFFQAAIISVYVLSKRFVSSWVSLFISVLFGTQPMLFGHAFINPKDIPLLATFLTALVLGLAMVDQWALVNTSQKTPENTTEHHEKYSKRKQILIVTLLATIVVIFGGIGWIRMFVLNFVEQGYTTGEASFAGRIFSSMPTSGSLDGYLGLANRAMSNAMRWVAFVTPVLLLALFYWIEKRRIFDDLIGLKTLLAAAVWGFALSTRLAAIGAGGLVGLYSLSKLGKKAILPLSIYSMSTAIFSFITWPFLWIYGIGGVIDSLKMLGNFPWTGRVLFDGQYYLPSELPYSYFPKLMLLQFSEPLVILVVIGFFFSLYSVVKEKDLRVEWMLLYLWLFIPLGYFAVTHATVYTNFRHVFFSIPPLFVFAGFAINTLAQKVRKIPLLLMLGLIAVLPGIVSINQLHPYEYIYYNSLIGGVRGAYNKYVLDYWTIAFKDAMDYINANAPTGSQILVWKNDLNGFAYANDSFSIAAHTEVPAEEYQTYDYMPIPEPSLAGSEFSGYPIIYSVEIDGVSLMYVLKLPGID